MKIGIFGIRRLEQSSIPYPFNEAAQDFDIDVVFCIPLDKSINLNIIQSILNSRNKILTNILLLKHYRVQSNIEYCSMIGFNNISENYQPFPVVYKQKDVICSSK